MRKSLLLFSLLLLTSVLYAQSILNDKAFYDTLKTHKTYGKLGFGLNINDDGERKVFLLQDASISRATTRHLFEVSNTIYFNSNGTDQASNRFLLFARAALNRHTIEGKKIVAEASFFPEVNFTIAYDESRGLNYRFNGGGGITYSLHKSKWMRLKIGTGLQYEKESWRIFEREFLPALDTLSQSSKDKLEEAFGINEKGNINKDNWRLNNYIQFVFTLGEKLNLSTLGIVQFPLRIPYDNVYNVPYFPVDNKKYPRFTLELSANFTITKHFTFSAKYFIQHDEGQISPLANEQISNFTNGLVYKF
jgi:hypothetical protein